MSRGQFSGIFDDVYAHMAKLSRGSNKPHIYAIRPVIASGVNDVI